MTTESWADRNIGKTKEMKIGAVIITALLIGTMIFFGFQLANNATVKESNANTTPTEQPSIEGKTYHLEDIIIGTGSVYKTYYFGGIIHDTGYMSVTDTLVINTWEPGPICQTLYIPIFLNSTITIGGHTFTAINWGYENTWIILAEFKQP